MTLSGLKQFWRRVMHRKPAVDASPVSGRASELAVVRKEQQALQSELNGLLGELAHLRSREDAQLAELQQRIDDLESGREAARCQVEELESSLQDATGRQTSSDKRIETLEGQLEQEHREHQVALQEAAEWQASIANRVETLKGQLEQEHREYRAALQEAVERQASTDSRVETLDGRLEREQREHRVALQEALVREQRQNRRLNLVMRVAGFALLLGTLAGIAELWDARNQDEILAELRGDFRDIKVSLEQRPGGLHGSAGETQATSPGGVANMTVPGLAGPEEWNAAGPLNGRTDTEAGMASPGYAFHPHSRHRSEAEMQAFFEENARQEGVIGLSSGLQYKVLNRGIGQSPKTSDTVVFDYRAFLPDGTELYNTYDEPQPATFRVDQVVNPGLQEALQRMEEGAQWELYIPPTLAYRGGTRKHRKYGFEPLIYVVELKSVIEGGEASNEN